MSAFRERRSPLLWAGLCFLLLFAGVGQLRFALTRSLPRGIYLALPAPQRFHAGDIVSFCLPSVWASRLRVLHVVGPGSCPGGAQPLAKRVVALSPHVCSSKDGIVIDGNSLPWPVFPLSVPLPPFRHCGSTPPDCLFVLGDGPDSIDSRTFGCIPRGSVLNRVVPLLTEAS